MVARWLPSTFPICIQSQLKTCTEADMYLASFFLLRRKTKNMSDLGAGRRVVVSEKVASINCHLSDYRLLGGGMCGVWAVVRRGAAGCTRKGTGPYLLHLSQ